MTKRKRITTNRVLRRDFYNIVRPKMILQYCESCGVMHDLTLHHVYRFSDQMDAVFEDLELVKYTYWDKYTKEQQRKIKRNMLGIQFGPESSYKTLCEECHELEHMKDYSDDDEDDYEGDDLYD